MGTVPDIYLRNQQLGDQLRDMQAEMNRQAEVANKAKSTWDKFRKERDFHKMHHKRVVQEKNKLITDLKRLKNHYSNFEPMLQMMRAKYETAMKEKMLMKLERDRLDDRASRRPEGEMRSWSADRGGCPRGGGEGGTRRPRRGPPAAPKKPRGAALPPDSRDNPHLEREYPPANVARWGLAKTFQGALGLGLGARDAPDQGRSSRRRRTTGCGRCGASRGRPDHVGRRAQGLALRRIDFSPAGRHLATCAEDGRSRSGTSRSHVCVQTLVEHTQAVWGVSYMTDHPEFVASCSMDHTAKLWDLTVGRCRQTFRGHVDSINAGIVFQPYANNIATALGRQDRLAVGLPLRPVRADLLRPQERRQLGRLRQSWRRRCLGRCRWLGASVGHPQGGGGGGHPASEHPCNSACFDLSGALSRSRATTRSCAATRRCAGNLLSTMQGNTDAVQCAIFGRNAAQPFLITGSTDCSFRTWRWEW